MRELEQRFETGFDPALSISADPTELVPPARWFLVARLDGQPVGCGALKVTGRKRGEIKRMWVAPAARGMGIAQRLLDALEEHAAAAGVNVLQLDTNRTLGEARALYARNGYAEIPAYNSNPYADHWYEKRGLQRRSGRTASSRRSTTDPDQRRPTKPPTKRVKYKCDVLRHCTSRWP